MALNDDGSMTPCKVLPKPVKQARLLALQGPLERAVDEVNKKIEICASVGAYETTFEYHGHRLVAAELAAIFGDAGYTTRFQGINDGDYVVDISWEP